MTRRKEPDARASRLLHDLPLSADQLRTRLQQAVDSAYWRQLCPDLPLQVDAGRPAAVPPAETEEKAATAAELARAGYFEVGRVVAPARAIAMRDAVEAVRRAGWPPVFSFVYDEFWSVWSAPPLASVLDAALGRGYRLIPHPWCWYVPAVRDAAGWEPHTDGWYRPRRMSIWVALSDATLDNGCMYVIPQDRIATLPIEDMVAGRSTLRWGQWAPLLHACRALPTAAGSALGWDFRTIHWGSVCHRAAEPRVSIAAYFIPRGVPRRREERRLFDPHRMPGFRDRLWAIASSIRYFKPNDVRNLRYLALADRLMRRLKSDAA